MPTLVKVTRSHVENTERTDAAAVAKRSAVMTSIKAHARETP